MFVPPFLVLLTFIAAVVDSQRLDKVLLDVGDGDDAAYVSILIS